MQRIQSGMCLILEFIHRGFRFHGNTRYYDSSNAIKKMKREYDWIMLTQTL